MSGRRGADFPRRRRGRRGPGPAADSAKPVEENPRRPSFMSTPSSGRARSGVYPAGALPPVKVLDGFVSGSFDVLEGGIYYIDRSSGDAGLRHRLGGQCGESPVFRFLPGVDTRRGRTRRCGFSLSASQDGRHVFFSRVDSSINKQMLVDNFR